MSTPESLAPNTFAPTTTARWLLLAGFAFPVLFAVSSVFDAIALVGEIPRPGSSAAEVAAFYRANSGDAVYVRAAIRLLAAVALAAFAFGVAAASRPRPLRWPGAVVATVSALLLAVSPSLSIVANATVTSADPQTLLALREWNYLLGGTVHLAVLGGWAALLLLGYWRDLPRVPRWLGVATAVAGLGVPLLEYLNPVARFVSWALVVALAITLLRSGRDRG